MLQKTIRQKASSHKNAPQKILSGLIHLLLALSSAIAMSTLTPGIWISVFLISVITASMVEWYLRGKGVAL